MVLTPYQARERCSCERRTLREKGTQRTERCCECETNALYHGSDMRRLALTDCCRA